MSESNAKRCPRCAEWKPATDFGKNARMRDGLQIHCRPCSAEFQREYRSRHPQKMRDLGRNNMQRRRDADPEGVREYMRRWRRSNPDLVRETKRAWEAANYETVRAAANAANARYRRANPDKVREHDLRRRARKAAAEVTPADLLELWDRQSGRCGICGTGLDREVRWPDPLSPSVDHIIPLSKGGAHAQSNLQWACLVCNLRKGTALLS